MFINSMVDSCLYVITEKGLIGKTVDKIDLYI